jgi:hypothetical protein
VPVVKLTPAPAGCRRVHEDMAAKVRLAKNQRRTVQRGRRQGRHHRLRAHQQTCFFFSILPACCRWFILKDGKIFWFKSDLVGPVRFDSSLQHTSCLPVPLLPRRCLPDRSLDSAPLFQSVFVVYSCVRGSPKLDWGARVPFAPVLFLLCLLIGSNSSLCSEPAPTSRPNLFASRARSRGASLR